MFHMATDLTMRQRQRKKMLRGPLNGLVGDEVKYKDETGLARSQCALCTIQGVSKLHQSVLTRLWVCD